MRRGPARRAYAAASPSLRAPVPGSARIAAVPTAAQAKLGDRAPLKSGMRGQDVRVLQDYLSKAGYDTGVDGQFGKRHAQVGQAHSRRPRRCRPNGVVSAADIAALRRSVEGGGVGPAQRSASRRRPARRPSGPTARRSRPPTPRRRCKQIIAAANEIEGMPYKYGGGHGELDDTGYDCSGSVSYALHGAGLLDDALPSGAFTTWGESGPGNWVTIYANGGHMYMTVAGLRFDTSARRSVGGALDDGVALGERLHRPPPGRPVDRCAAWSRRSPGSGWHCSPSHRAPARRHPPSCARPPSRGRSASRATTGRPRAAGTRRATRAGPRSAASSGRSWTASTCSWAAR